MSQDTNSSCVPQSPQGEHRDAQGPNTELMKEAGRRSERSGGSRFRSKSMPGMRFHTNQFKNQE